MSYWERVPPVGERQYLTQAERNDQCINQEEEAATQTIYNSCLQQPEIDFHRLFHKNGPLRGKLPHNVTMHYNGEMQNKRHEKESYFRSEFSPPSIFETGHEDVSHHTNADRGYRVGPDVDIQNTNIDAKIPAGNNAHCKMALRPIKYCVQASTVTAQQGIMALPVMESSMSVAVDLEVAQVENADIDGVTEPSLPLKAIINLTDSLGNADLVFQAHTSATPEQQQASCSSPKHLSLTRQGKPNNTNIISFKKIQDWIQSVQTESKKRQQLKTKGKSMPSDQLCAEESATLQLEIKSNHRSMTLTAVAAIPPPVAIIPPLGLKQSTKPMETGNMDKEVPFENLKAFRKKQSMESPQVNAKDNFALLDETGTFQKRMVYHKPVDTSPCSLVSDKQDSELIQVISETDKRSPLPYVHTNTTVNDVTEAQTIMEFDSNRTEGKMYLSTIGDIPFKLCTLRQLVNVLEGSVTNKEAKDSCLETVLLKQYWGNGVEALKDLTDHKIMQDVSEWAIEDENAVTLFAANGITMQELVKEFPSQGHVDSSLLVDYKSLWLNINEKLDDIDKESERVWSLGFIPDKAEENASTEVVDGIEMDNSFLSKTETIVLTPQQPGDKELIKDRDPQIDKIIMETNSPTDTDLPSDADSETDPLSKIILTVHTPDDALKLFAEIEEPDTDRSTDKDAETATDLITDIDTDPPCPMNLTVLTSEDAVKLMCQIEKDSVIELGSPAQSCKTHTKLLQNMGSCRFDKPCYCPCFIETNNRFEVVLCSSCQKEKILPQSLRYKPKMNCVHLLDACANSDQETETVLSDLGKTTEQETDDKQFSNNKTEEEILQSTSTVHTSGILFLSEENQDSDQETHNKSCAEHKTKSATCNSAQECTSQNKFGLLKLGSENREIQKNDQDFQLSILPLFNVNMCLPIEDCNSLRDEYDTFADFVNHHKTLKSKEKMKPKILKNNPLHPVPSDREESKIRHDGGEKGQSQTPPIDSSVMMLTIENQHRHKKPHSSQKRHLTEVTSGNNQSQNKVQKSSTVQKHISSQSKDKKLSKKQHSTAEGCEGHQSRHKRTSPGEGGQASQLRNKKSRKRPSNEAEGRYSGDSRELEPQSVKRMKGSSESCSVKIFPIQGASSSTASPKLPINVYDKLNSYDCKGKEVPKMQKIDPPKKSRHHFQKAIIRKASPPNQEMVEGSLLKQKRLEVSSSSQKRIKEDKGKPGDTGVKPLLTSLSSDGKLVLLKSKAVSVLTSEELKVTNAPKELNRNEEKLKKIKRMNNTLLPKPTLQRNPKLSNTKNIPKDGNQNKNRPEASISDFPEPQLLNKPVRVSHKPKPFNKHSSPSRYGPSNNNFPHLTRLSPPCDKIYSGRKVSARQQVLTDWKNSFVPTKLPPIHRKSGCLLQGVEEKHASHGTRTLKTILKRVDSQSKPKLKVNFPLNPRRVKLFRRCEFEAEVMFNRSWTDPKDANPSEEQDAHVDCKNAVEQPFVRKEKMQDKRELKPGASRTNEKMIEVKHQMPEQTTHLVKKSMVQAKIWTNYIHHEPLKDHRHTEQNNGVGYKWSEKRSQK